MKKYFDSCFYNEEVEVQSLEVWSYDEEHECWDLEQMYFEIDDEYVEQDVDDVVGMMLSPNNTMFVGIEISEEQFNKMLGGF